MFNTSNQTEQTSTKDIILNSAEKIFIQKGFAATSMSQIAKEAKVTKSLIHHYFGSKERLWTEIKDRCLTDYFEVQRKMLEMAEPDAQCMQDSIVALFRVLQESPDFVRLLSWHLAELNPDDDTEEKNLTQLGLGKILEAQEKGNIRQDIDPRYGLIVFYCLIFSWFQGKRTYLDWVGVKQAYEETDEKYLETLIKIFFEGVLPR
jgi:TetR/AcrR family transcriptional regulator